MDHPQRAAGIAIALVPLVFGVSCGPRDDIAPLYPAEGKVFYEMKPAFRAIVWLHAIDATNSKTPKPHGRVDKDGNFRLGTYKTDDGAPAGKYRVLISWNAEVKSGDVDGESLLPSRYQSLEKSGLPIVEIKEGNNQLAPFYLTR